MKNDIKNLTIDEKIELLTGYTAWDIHKIDKLDKFNMSDGPCGLRKISYNEDRKEVAHSSTCYASPAVLGNSWDMCLVKQAASAMADDCIDENVDMLLAPGINIKRDPRCGRHFEYVSEDPLLAGTYGKVFIDGLQEKGVGTSLKHYCCNNEEDNRQSCDSVVSKRALMEIYTRNFYYACKAKPTTVMCAYNKVNGLWCSENTELNDILYNKLGFDGAIVSDWEAVHHKVPSVKSGLALQMPYRKGMFEEVKEALSKGEVSEAEIDVCAGRTIDLINKIQEMKPLRKTTTDLTGRLKIAYNGVIGGAVLLKNDGILPLKTGVKLGLAGNVKDYAFCGGGSAHVIPSTPVISLKQALLNKGYDVLETKDIIYNTWHGHAEFSSFGAVPGVDAFSDADYVIYHAATSKDVESEGFDRHDLRLDPVIEANIRHIGDTYKGKVVVVLNAGAPIDVSAWIDHVSALLFVGFGGTCQNDATVDLLFGLENPSGKLSETWPNRLEDISCLNPYDSYMMQNFYTDGIYVGYRHYDKNNIKPRFEFGYGLSYSKFDYANLSVKDLGNKLEVSYEVKNVSDVDGKEVSQIYMYSPAKVIDRPIKELIGWDKTMV
ncbi:MAG: glycoside hydrolase family 3 C-terminal domain-containing protein, partial [Clostridia bacterium]|nr:glycoside hydrolase family 3 C-terminal domain-containing protein [Clostridia bacterium]